MAYATAYTARVGTGANPLPTLQTVNARAEAREAAVGPGTVPLLLARLDYAAVRPDAFPANLLRLQNGQVFDVAGRTQNSYKLLKKY